MPTGRLPTGVRASNLNMSGLEGGGARPLCGQGRVWSWSLYGEGVWHGGAEGSHVTGDSLIASWRIVLSVSGYGKSLNSGAQ